MDIAIVIGLLVAFGSILIGFIEEGGALTPLLQFSAAIIVFGGTFGAVGVSFPGKVIKKFPKVLKIAFKKRESNIADNIRYFKEISTKTRREGLLTLEGEFSNENIKPFIKKEFQLVVDGTEQSTTQSILETKLEQIVERHEEGIEMFAAAGGYAPTMGIMEL